MKKVAKGKVVGSALTTALTVGALCAFEQLLMQTNQQMQR